MLPFILHRSDDGAVRLELVGELTIEHVRDLRDALVGQPGVTGRIEIDCRELTRLDAASVQLMVSLARTGSRACVRGRNDAWTQAFQRYGLSDPFSEAS